MASPGKKRGFLSFLFGKGPSKDEARQHFQPKKPKHTKVALEVKPSTRGDKLYVPRNVMTAPEILAGIETQITLARNAAAQNKRFDFIAENFRTGVQPALRQAVEQAGGDGVDAWLRQTLRPPGPPAHTPLVMALANTARAIRTATKADELLELAPQFLPTIREAFAEPQRASLKVAEKELEGHLDVGELLEVLFASDEELASREDELNKVIEDMRQVLKAVTGGRADGSYGNWSRFKAKQRLLVAERKRRTR